MKLNINYIKQEHQEEIIEENIIYLLIRFQIDLIIQHI
jgi:hypothetical protein